MPEALSVTEPVRQLVGGGRQRQISRFLGNFDDLTLGLVLVKADLGAQLEAVTNWITS